MNHRRRGRRPFPKPTLEPATSWGRVQYFNHRDTFPPACTAFCQVPFLHSNLKDIFLLEKAITFFAISVFPKLSLFKQKKKKIQNVVDKLDTLCVVSPKINKIRSESQGGMLCYLLVLERWHCQDCPSWTFTETETPESRWPVCKWKSSHSRIDHSPICQIFFLFNKELDFTGRQIAQCWHYTAVFLVCTKNLMQSSTIQGSRWEVSCPVPHSHWNIVLLVPLLRRIQFHRDSRSASSVVQRNCL